jgi:hypothetical protein
MGEVTLHFDRIVFAVFDSRADGANLKPFERHFPGERINRENVKIG